MASGVFLIQRQRLKRRITPLRILAVSYGIFPVKDENLLWSSPRTDVGTMRLHYILISILFRSVRHFYTNSNSSKILDLDLNNFSSLFGCRR